MEKLKYLSLIVFSLLMFASCEDNDPQKFLEQDSHVSFPITTVSVAEESADVLRIPIAYASAKGGFPVTVTVASNTEGQASPAIEGIDYIIQNKQITIDSGAGVGYVLIEPIDNDVFTGRKTFNLVITGVTPDLPQQSVQTKVTVSILDNEHPLAAIIGSYTMAAESLWDGDITMPAFVSPSDDDTNVLLLDFGFGGAAEMNIAEVDGEILITIPAFQTIGPSSGSTVILSWSRVEGNSIYYSTSTPITAVFEDGKIIFDTGAGMLVTNSSGALTGWMDAWWEGTIVLTKNK